MTNKEQTTQEVVKKLNDGYHKVALYIDNMMAQKKITYFTVQELSAYGKIPMQKAQANVAELLRYGYLEPKFFNSTYNGLK